MERIPSGSLPDRRLVFISIFFMIGPIASGILPDLSLRHTAMLTSFCAPFFEGIPFFSLCGDPPVLLFLGFFEMPRKTSETPRILFTSRTLKSPAQ